MEELLFIYLCIMYLGSVIRFTRQMDLIWSE
jgi:hypothetical protein